MIKLFSFVACFIFISQASAQQKTGKKKANQPSVTVTSKEEIDSAYKNLKWRNIGPTRGGRSVTATGVVNDPLVYYLSLIHI